MVDLIVNTYEEGRDTPVVTHVFHGETKAEAIAFYRAHLKSDKFLRDCESKGSFKGMRCRNVVVGFKEHGAGQGLRYSDKEQRIC